MKNIDEIIKLIDSKQYKTAIESIEKSDDSNEPHLNYLVGHIYQQYDNPERSNELADKYFSKVVEADRPISDAFIRLANLKESKEHALRILNKGLVLFPQNVSLYEEIIKRNPSIERQKIFEEVEKKGLFSKEITLLKIETFYDLKKYQETIHLLNQVNAETDKEKQFINLISGYCSYELNDYKKAFSIFFDIIKDDIKNDLQYCGHIGAIISAYEYDINLSEKYFDELPKSLDINPYLFYPYSSFDFNIDKYIEILFLLLNKSKKNKIKAKIKGIRGIYRYLNHGENINYRSILKDLLAAYKEYPYEKFYIENIIWINLELNERVEAFTYCLKYCETSIEEEKLYYSKWTFIKELKGSELTEAIRIFCSRFDNNEVRIDTLIIKEIFSSLVEATFKEKDFNQVIKLKSYLDNKHLIKSSVLFEIAYSYSEINQIDSAEEYYNLYCEKRGITSAVSNNLGVIYEKKGMLEKAIKHFEKAIELDNSDDIAKKNLKRLNKLYEEEKKENIELTISLDEFKKENPWIKNKILKFNDYKDTDGFITCPYRQLPQYLSVSSIKATDLIKTFLNKKYVIKIYEHELTTSSSVYRINPFIETYLVELKKELVIEEELLLIAEKLNCEQITKLGYNSELLNAINKINDDQLREMILRDMKENTLSLITRSFKATIVLSGSVIEASLLFYVQGKGFSSYKLENGKTKKIISMDLNELLYLAKEEKYIDDHIYHLGHAIRGYRNLIHPGVEQRKKTLKISYDNAKLAWDITRKILLELFL
ncbi:MAG: tetratricopeptide repeat protein [Ignavibacteriaceae bacterium]|jgi:tetratricopeptide (TPR) repeat protein|nr:tetratricopeptide repeat protein [Ignavibacteriaceae bacterium]